MIAEKIQALTDDQVFEAARAVFPEMLEVWDEGEAATRATQEMDLYGDEAKAFKYLVRNTAESEPAEIAALLRLALLAALESDKRDHVAAAVEDAGKKMTVVGLDLIALGAFLLIGYVAVKGGGKESATKTETVKKHPDGTVEVTISEETRYLNPMSGLAKIFGGFLKP